ncbi:MAG TPA: glucokinase [Rhizomicrobium sp.]|jgi:glucokinase
MSQTSQAQPYGLVADIGGTNVRLATVGLNAREPQIGSLRVLSTQDHPDIVAAAKAYLREAAIDAPPHSLVFAVAGPIKNNEIQLTNAGWRISAKALQEGLGAASAKLVNDFEAVAQAVPHLRESDLKVLGPSPAFDPLGDGTIAIVGPGTGLGVSGLVSGNGARLALVTEGGHAAFAPTDAMEMRVVEFLMRRYGRVSAERILSGPGLLNLYGAMAEISGVTPNDRTPENITAIARSDSSSFEAKVFARFCAILGSVAGDVALIMGARRGVLIAGGILPDAAELIAQSDFRRRFEDKARFRTYMSAIPTALILQPHVGLIGAASVLLRDFSSERG